jgi:hypothetical protein
LADALSAKSDKTTASHTILPVRSTMQIPVGFSNTFSPMECSTAIFHERVLVQGPNKSWDGWMGMSNGVLDAIIAEQTSNFINTRFIV